MSINWSRRFVTATLDQIRSQVGCAPWLQDFQSLSPSPYDVTALSDAYAQIADIGAGFGYRLHHTVWTPSGFLFVFEAVSGS